MGAAADFHALSRTSDLLSQIVKPLLSSSNDFSPLGNSFQQPSFLRTSSWLSSTLFSSLSSPLNSVELLLTHFTSVPPVQFFSAQSKWHSCKLSCSGQLKCLSIQCGFSIRLCYHSRVMCYHLILPDCWLLPVGPTFKHAWAAAFFPRARRAVTSRAAICQERTWAAQPHASLSPAAWKAKRTRTRKQHSCARHRNAAKRGKRRQHSRALFFPASFCYTPKMSPSQYSLRKVSGRPERWETAAWCSVPPRTAAKRADGVPTESIRQAWGATMIAAKARAANLVWKNCPNERISSWSGRFAVAREWLKSEPKCKSCSWNAIVAGRRTSCKGLLNVMPKVKVCRRSGQRMLQIGWSDEYPISMLQFRRQTDFCCRDQLQRSPRCKCVRPFGKLAAPGVSENKPPARKCRKPTGQRKDGKRQPPTLKSLPKQNLTAAASCVCTGWKKPQIISTKVKNICCQSNIRNAQTAITIWFATLSCKTQVLRTHPQQRGTLTQPFHCDLQRLSCKTQ